MSLNIKDLEKNDLDIVRFEDFLEEEWNRNRRSGVMPWRMRTDRFITLLTALLNLKGSNGYRFVGQDFNQYINNQSVLIFKKVVVKYKYKLLHSIEIIDYLKSLPENIEISDEIIIKKMYALYSNIHGVIFIENLSDNTFIVLGEPINDNSNAGNVETTNVGSIKGNEQETDGEYIRQGRPKKTSSNR